MNNRRFAARCGLMVSLVLPALGFAQTGPAENAWGLDYEGKAIVAVLPLAGSEEEQDMALRFHRGTLEAVAALGKYSPRDLDMAAIENAGLEIPTDMPPNRNLSPGARYALTGGVYPGNKAREYYLQLWLWDMSGSTMIYTDDLVYEDIEDAMQSLPGLVEWLFSHIREVVVETPEPVIPYDPLLMLGLRAGLSPRWYFGPEEPSPGAWALSYVGGVSGVLRLNALLALELEVLFTQDTLVYWGAPWVDGDYALANKNFASPSLMIPLLLKLNFKPGPFRLSPLAGIYAAVPLGQTRYRGPGEEGRDYGYSFSVPAGFTAGFEAAVKYGPGMLFAGLRYAGDFGEVIIGNEEKTTYRRHMVSLSLGYEFGFFNINK
jgi:hypothetical protein